MTMEDHIVVAKIVAAHGLHGLFKIKAFTESPGNLAGYPIFLTDSGLTLCDIKIKRLEGDFIIASFKGIEDRTSADKLIGCMLSVEASQRPKIDEDNSYYWTDLQGLRVHDTEGNIIGTVIEVCDYGAGTFLEIRDSDQKIRTLPFNKASVLEVLLESKTMIISTQNLL